MYGTVWCEFDPPVPMPRSFTCSIQAQVLMPEPEDEYSYDIVGHYPTFQKRELNLRCETGDLDGLRASNGGNLLRPVPYCKEPINDYFQTSLICSFSYITRN